MITYAGWNSAALRGEAVQRWKGLAVDEARVVWYSDGAILPALLD